MSMRAQHGHRGNVSASATINRLCSVAIELGTWRSGRIGGAAGSVIFGNGRHREPPGRTRSRGGNRLLFGNQKSVRCDAQRAVMMETRPSATLVVSKSY